MNSSKLRSRVGSMATDSISAGRSRRGAGLALVAALLSIMIAVGIWLIWLMLVTGGSRELRMATDSGVLNVAKQAVINPGVTLTQQEMQYFWDLTDANGKITLRNYNYVVGRALLVGLDAKRANNPVALQNAKMYADMALTGSRSIGQRLHDALTQGAVTAGTSFGDLACTGSLRMVTTAATKYDPTAYATAYVDAGTASNVWIGSDFEKMLPADALSQYTGTAGHRMIAGYTPITIDINGTKLVYEFVPVHPGEQPHLISQVTFDATTEQKFVQQEPRSLQGKIPPNSFRGKGVTTERISSMGMLAQSCAVVAVTAQHPADMGLAWITVNNPKGYTSFGKVPVIRPGNGIAMSELTTGIFLAADTNGKPVAFSTDPNAIGAWIAFNNSGTGKPPAAVDGSGATNIFDADGNPAGAATLAKLKKTAVPSGGCNQYNVVGPNGTVIEPNCSELFPGFINAYGGEIGTVDCPQTQLLAVEKFQDLLIEALDNIFAEAGGADSAFYYEYVGHSHSSCATIPGLDLGQQKYSGLRIFNRNQSFGWVGTSTTPPVISRPGTIHSLTQQVGNGAPSAYSSLVANVMLIKPEATLPEITALLSSVTLDLNTTHYIYLSDPKGARKLRFTDDSATVPGFQSGITPDGLLSTYSSGQYNTIGTIVDGIEPAGERAFIYPPYPVNATAQGDDYCLWQPGYTSLCLGKMEFRNTCSGSGTFCGPN